MISFVYVYYIICMYILVFAKSPRFAERREDRRELDDGLLATLALKY